MRSEGKSVENANMVVEVARPTMPTSRTRREPNDRTAWAKNGDAMSVATA